MSFDVNILKDTERAVFALRSLYSSYGYSQYRMSKFEEYDLYVKNKDFLISDSVITFTDTNGKLMALKPDVTLSIVKNGREKEGGVQKVYYDENVYRVSKGTQGFKEIMQVGLECIGELDGYCISEAVALAAKSLLTVSDKCVLDISHLGLLSRLTEAAHVPECAKAQIIACIGEKNPHGLSRLCEENGVSEEGAELLRSLIGLYGEPRAVIEKLSGLCDCPELSELSELCNALGAVGLGDVIRIDFSVVSDTDYYNGIVFKGFIEGVPGSVLSGGQYDGLMEKLGRKENAIGFAVYLDMLEHFYGSSDALDADVVLLYSEEPLEHVLAAAEKLSQSARVSVLKKIPEKMRYAKLATLENGEVKLLENNA